MCSLRLLLYVIIIQKYILEVEYDTKYKTGRNNHFSVATDNYNLQNESTGREV